MSVPLAVNTLRALAEGVAQQIEDGADPTLDIEWQPSGKYAAGKRGIYLKRLPTQPDEVIVLSPRQLTAHATLADATYALQARFRGGKDPRSVWAMVSAVRVAVLGVWPTTLSTGLEVRCVEFAGGTPLPADSQDREQWTDNFVFSVGEQRGRPF